MTRERMTTLSAPMAALLLAVIGGTAIAQEGGTATDTTADTTTDPATDPATDTATDAATEPSVEPAAEAAPDPAADASAEGAAPAADASTAVAYDDNGRYYTADDTPTFNVQADGTVDWLTYSGFRRYHAECHVCHGPDGEGSTYAPALKDSAMRMDYYAFYDVVVNGRQNVTSGQNNVMPSFGDNPNVMCYLDDIWVYLRAHGSGAIPRGRPAGREDKSDAIRDAENACLGT